jgi:hypothetical protein
MGEIIHLSRERIEITVYTRGRGWFGGRAAEAHHKESEQTLAVVCGVVKELGQWYFDVRTRPWATHFYQALPHGGWRAPVVQVGHSVFSQGCIPDRAKLRAYLNDQIHILRPRLAKSS